MFRRIIGIIWIFMSGVDLTLFFVDDNVKSPSALLVLSVLVLINGAINIRGSEE